MDTTFYEDSRYRAKDDMHHLRAMKRPMTLDLDSGKSNSKKPRVTSLLTSPDLNMLKLGSPELERLIIAQHGLVTVTPTPNQSCMYPKNDDRETYNRDFADALSGLHQTTTGNGMYHQQQHQSDVMTNNMVSNCNNMPPSNSMVDTFGYQNHQMSNCNPMVSSTSANMNGNCYAPVVSTNGFYGLPPSGVVIKEEPQTVPCMGTSPPQSPIDMENQERMKLERKRLRNRIAASKCRRRKLERIARLEDKVSHLKNENTELTNHVQRLRDQVCQLKQQVMDHVRSGCEILVSNYSSYPEDM